MYRTWQQFGWYGLFLIKGMPIYPFFENNSQYFLNSMNFYTGSSPTLKKDPNSSSITLCFPFLERRTKKLYQKV